MTRFIEGKSLQFFLRPGRFGVKLLGRSGSILFSALKRITGIDLLQDLSEFFQSFGDMAQGFRERAQRVNELLGDRRTTFLLVSAPERDPIEEAFYFWRRLTEARLPFAGVVVNKVHPDYVRVQEGEAALPQDSLVEDLKGSLDGTPAAAELATKVAQNFENYRMLAERDRENMKLLTQRIDADRVLEVPYFDEDVHDIAGLALVNRYLFASGAERQELLEQATV
jgi:anion-transporting  ArsA/GET3 family ATPase